jgi:hypothetical protein
MSRRRPGAPLPVKLNEILIALRVAGLRYDGGEIEITDLRSYRSWQRYGRGHVRRLLGTQSLNTPGPPRTESCR